MSGIAVFCPLRDLNPAYSVAGVVKNTLDVLNRKGIEVLFITTSDFKDKKLLGENVKVKYIDRYYTQNKPIFITEMACLLRTYLKDIEIVITHDIAFLPDYSLYAAALLEVVEGKKVFHWVHSTPGKDYISTYPEVICYSPFPNSKYIFPSSGNKEELKNRFLVKESSLKTVYNFQEDRPYFSDLDLSQYDYITQYAVRLCPGKRIPLWIKFLEELQNSSGKKVLGFLSLAYPDQEKLKELRKLIKKSKVKIIVVNDYYCENSSVPKKVVKFLNQICDLFILSSAGEANSLIWMEAMLSKQLCVVQKTIECTKEFGSSDTIFCDLEDEEDRKIAIDSILRDTSKDSFRKIRRVFDNDWIFRNQFCKVLGIRSRRT